MADCKSLFQFSPLAGVAGQGGPSQRLSAGAPVTSGPGDSPASTSFREPFAAEGVIRTGYYLGVPIVVVKDLGDGWVIGLFPDKVNPGRSHGKPKPFTYRKLEWWKLCDSQVVAGDPDVALPDFPATLKPKPIPETGLD